MRQVPFSTLSKLPQYSAALIFCAILMFSVCHPVQAQSGRRTPKRASVPVSPTPPAEAETPEPPVKSTAPKVEPQLSLIVATDKLGLSIGIPLYLHDAAINGFIERLRQSLALSMTLDDKLNRREASDLAKAKKEVHVVWVQLEGETFDADAAMGRVNQRDMVVSYILFVQGTGKIKTQGRVYQRPYRGVLSRRMPRGRSAAEYQLYEAGREAAERVMEALLRSTAPPPVERR